MLLAEVLEALSPREGESFLDLTVGLGGHSSAVLDLTAPGGRLVGIDRDADALAVAATRLDLERSLLLHGNFGELPELRKRLPQLTFDMVLADLGVSSPQLDEGNRGFSFRNDGPLDMRMDRSGKLDARAFLETVEETELMRVISDFGEERKARRVAQAIIQERAVRPIESTGQLARIIRSVLPHARKGHVDPATRTFQAIRIAINRELEALSHLLDRFETLLSPGGRFAVISYHSLEDRQVKEAFKLRHRELGHEVLTPRPLRPGESEVAQNPRSRSARLRVIRRHREGENR